MTKTNKQLLRELAQALEEAEGADVAEATENARAAVQEKLQEEEEQA